MNLSPDQERKLANKRFNERVKLAYNTLNVFAIGVFGAAFIVPGVSAAAPFLEPQRAIWFLVAAALHMVAQIIVGLLRSED